MDQIKIIYKTIQGLEIPSEDELLLSSFPLNDQQSVEQMEAELHDNPELHKQLVSMRIKLEEIYCKCSESADLHVTHKMVYTHVLIQV